MPVQFAAREPLYSALAADPDLAEIVELFVAELPGRLSALRRAFETGDRELVGRLAHQLKGAGGSYGFDALTHSAAQLEKAARGDQSNQLLQAALDQLAATASRVRAGTPSPSAV